MVILPFLRKRVDFVAEEFVVALAVDLVRPPSQSIRAVVVGYDLGFSSQIREIQTFLEKAVDVFETH